MTSNVYLAFGTKDGQHFMKVGKANVVLNRQRQIGIQIELSVPCATERDAFTLETKLRQMMRKSGGVPVSRTKDWFVFDGRVYDDLRAFVTNESGIAALLRYGGKLSAEDYEIAILRARCAALYATEVADLESALDSERAQHMADNERLLRELADARVAAANVELEMYKSGRIKPGK